MAIQGLPGWHQPLEAAICSLGEGPGQTVVQLVVPAQVPVGLHCRHFGCAAEQVLVSRGGQSGGDQVVPFGPGVQAAEEGNQVNVDQVEAHGEQGHTNQDVGRGHHHRYVLHATGCETTEADGYQAEEAEVPTIQQGPLLDQIEDEGAAGDVGDQDYSREPDWDADGLLVEETGFVAVGHGAGDDRLGPGRRRSDEFVGAPERVSQAVADHSQVDEHDEEADTYVEHGDDATPYSTWEHVART